MAHDVFISYSIKDRLLADALCHKLEEDNVRCWIAPRDISPGGSWAGEIADAIPKSKIMILVFSSNANASKQVLREVELAITNNLTVIPMKIEDTSPTGGMSYYLSTTHWIDAIGNKFDKRISTLSKKVQVMLGIDLKITKTETKPGPTTELKPVHVESKPVPVEKAKHQKSTVKKFNWAWVYIPTIVIIVLIGGYFAINRWFPQYDFLLKATATPPPTHWNTIPNRTPWSINDMVPDIIIYKPEDYGYDPDQGVFIEDDNLLNAIIETLNATRLKAISPDELTIADMFDLKYLLISPEVNNFDFRGTEILCEILNVNYGNFHVSKQANLYSLNGLQYARNLLGLYLFDYDINNTSPIQSLDSLLSLDFFINGIADIENLGGLSTLRWLRIHDYTGVNLDLLADMSNLYFLSIYGATDNQNPLNLMTLVTLPSIDTLDIANFKIFDLSPLNSLKNIHELILVNCRISDISSLNNLTTLDYLDVRNNYISKITDFSGLTNLKRLFLTDNPVISIEGLSDLSSLQELYIDSSVHLLNEETINDLIKLGCIVYSNTETPENYGLNRDDIVNFEDPALKAAISSTLMQQGYSVSENITIGDMFRLTTLFIVNDIYSNDLLDQTYIQTITGYENVVFITESGVENLGGLEYARNLSAMYISSNPVNDINPLLELSNLKLVFIDNSFVSDISEIGKLTSLQWLSLKSNYIDDINSLGALTSLKLLILDNNHINDIKSLTNLEKLDTLSLNNTKIEDLGELFSQSSFSNLSHLQIADNIISDLSPLSDTKSLEILNIEGNPNLTDLSPLLELENLRELLVDDNMINSNLETLAELEGRGCSILKQNE